MLKIRLKKLAIVATVLFLQPMVSPGSFALAKRRKSPPRAFSFWAENGKASQEECDGERKVPRKLKHLKEFAKAGYIGSEAQTFEIKDKEEKEMFKHFFNSKSACNAVLAKTPSYAKKSLKDVKQELPPDEAAESDDDDQSDDQQQEAPEAPVSSEKTVHPTPSATPEKAPSPSPSVSPAASVSPSPAASASPAVPAK